MKEIRTLDFKLGLQTSFIQIGKGILANVAEDLNNLVQSQQVILLSNDIVYGLYGKDLLKALKKQGFRVLTQIIPDGESYKSWQMAEILMEEMLKAGFKQDAIMLSLGGGVISDLGGFVAAIYQGGIDYIQIPTTLTSQVDSAVGGKISLNHPLERNLIGTYYLPLAVYEDINTLQTLPRKKFVLSIVRIIRYAVIGDKVLFDLLEKNLNRIMTQHEEILQELIYRSCQTKVQIINQAESREGLEEILGYGQGIGKSLIKLDKKFPPCHAEAIGMVASGKIAVAMGLLNSIELKRLENLLVQLELPIAIPNEIPVEKIISEMNLDGMILPNRLGQVERVANISKDVILKVLKS